MGKSKFIFNTLLKGLQQNTTVGSRGVKKHDLLVWAQQLNSTIHDGGTVGRAISKLVYEGYLVKLNPNKKPILYERIK